MIFETHAHYDDEQFNTDRAELLPALYEQGIRRIVNAGASMESTARGIELADTYEFFYAAAGVHPSDVQELTEKDYEWLKQQCSLPKVVAVGEIGLDYYWEKEAEAQERQRYWFMKQMALAKETGLPVIIHSRDAASDTIHCMKEAHAQEIPGVVHCYSYSRELAREFLDMGYLFGIGGVLTFKNARKLVETVEYLPMDRILLETDAPYLAPEPYRGKRNQSAYLTYVAEKIAEIKGITPEEVCEITFQNSLRLFKKVKSLD